MLPILCTHETAQEIGEAAFCIYAVEKVLVLQYPF